MPRYHYKRSGGMHFKDGVWIDFAIEKTDLPRAAAINGILRDGKLSPGDVGPLEISSHERPTELVLEKNPKTLPDAFVSDRGATVVRRPLAEMIEELDPGLHTMWPVSVYRRRGRASRPDSVPPQKGEPYEGDWFVLVVTERRDTLDPEHSEVTPFTMGLPFFHVTEWKKRIALHTSALPDDIHLWRETRLGGSGYIGSDRFGRELKARGLRFLDGFDARPS